MLSEIERIFPTICTNMKIDINGLIAIRKSRSKLFNETYFSNKFWDIILLLYGSEINEHPVDAKAIAANLEIGEASAMRYLQALFADDIICADNGTASKPFNLAEDSLSLTARGFENAATVIQQMRMVFATSTKP